ncbi:MAG: hypothetical protein JW748_11575 [Anaerolineales bacterium]|nr:hypothetical protein [Anaerolineales bacterium]
MNPGKVTFLSSGETSPTGGMLFRKLSASLPRGYRVAILETPAGFEPNSAKVAGRVADAIALRTAEFSPRIDVIPARRKAKPFSTDSVELLRPLAAADLVYMGAGSPTYAVRQLRGSLAWRQMLAGWQQGAQLVMASAAAVAVGSVTLPVYEIFKAGEDPEWKPGLDLFGPIGWKLAVISHWNNTGGGEDLDTSRCFIGRERFDALARIAPSGTTILGLDEHTAAVLDWSAGRGRVEGKGTITIIRDGHEKVLPADAEFPLDALGEYRIPSEPFGVEEKVWEEVRARRAESNADPVLPPEVIALLQDRERARRGGEFADADRIRMEIERMGWSVTDSPNGAILRPLRKG